MSLASLVVVKVLSDTGVPMHGAYQGHELPLQPASINVRCVNLRSALHRNASDPYLPLSHD